MRPAHRAAYWGQPGVAALLLARGAERGVLDANGKLALDLACAGGGGRDAMLPAVVKALRPPAPVYAS